MPNPTLACVVMIAATACTTPLLAQRPSAAEREAAAARTAELQRAAAAEQQRLEAFQREGLANAERLRVAERERAEDEARRRAKEEAARAESAQSAASDATPVPAPTVPAIPEKVLLARAASGALCSYSVLKQSLLSEIREERRYSSVGGVVNLRALYELQSQVRAVDARTKRTQQALAKRRLKVLRCSERDVQRVNDCHELGFIGNALVHRWSSDSDCRSAEMMQYSDALDGLD